MYIWIPAFAGMTSEALIMSGAGMTSEVVTMSGSGMTSEARIVTGVGRVAEVEMTDQSSGGNKLTMPPASRAEGDGKACS